VTKIVIDPDNLPDFTNITERTGMTDVEIAAHCKCSLFVVQTANKGGATDKGETRYPRFQYACKMAELLQEAEGAL